ncbi:hypothetical protein [Desulfofundulus kuznetsovii]|uniref:hypothetical protein n=1 Tax=Desulfofundulus kuznetsovii TaxID=58135 RepID=UPI000310145F
MQVKNLVSRLLACTLKLLVWDWPALYVTDPFLVETFVDQDKYKGAKYDAASTGLEP